MKPNNNKEFFTALAKIVDDTKEAIREVLEEYYFHFIVFDHDSYHTVGVPLMLDSIKDIYMNAISSIKQLEEHAEQKFDSLIREIIEESNIQ